MHSYLHVIRDETLHGLPDALHVATKNLAFDPTISAWICFQEPGTILWDILNAFRVADWNNFSITPTDGSEELFVIHPYRGVVIVTERDKNYLCTIAHAGWISAEETDTNWREVMRMKRHSAKPEPQQNFFAERTATTPTATSSSSTQVTRVRRPDPIIAEIQRAETYAREFADRSDGLLEVDETPPISHPSPPERPTPIAEYNLDRLISAVAGVTAAQAAFILKRRTISSWADATLAQSPLDRRGRFHPLIIKMLEKRKTGKRFNVSLEILMWMQEDAEFYEDDFRVVNQRMAMESDEDSEATS